MLSINPACKAPCFGTMRISTTKNTKSSEEIKALYYELKEKLETTRKSGCKFNLSPFYDFYVIPLGKESNFTVPAFFELSHTDPQKIDKKRGVALEAEKIIGKDIEDRKLNVDIEYNIDKLRVSLNKPLNTVLKAPPGELPEILKHESRLRNWIGI